MVGPCFSYLITLRPTISRLRILYPTDFGGGRHEGLLFQFVPAEDLSDKEGCICGYRIRIYGSHELYILTLVNSPYICTHSKTACLFYPLLMFFQDSLFVVQAIYAERMKSFRRKISVKILIQKTGGELSQPRCDMKAERHE